MKIINLSKNNMHQLLFIMLLSISECAYLMSEVFEVDNSFVFACLAVMIIMFIAVLISSLPRVVSAGIFIVIGTGVSYLLRFYFEQIYEYIRLIINAAANSNCIGADNTIALMLSLAVIFILINFIIIVLIKSPAAAAVLSLVLVCGIYYLYSNISLTFAMYHLFVVLLIFMMIITPSKSDRPLASFALLVAIAVIVAPITVLVADARIEPLAWIDDIDWFEEDEPERKVITVVRIDGQSKITDFADEYKYSDSQMMMVTSPYMDRLRSKTYDLYNKDGWTKALADDAENQHMQYTGAALTGLLIENNIPYDEYEMTVYLGAHSQMIFAPLHAELNEPYIDSVHVNPYDDLYMDEPLAEGSEYILSAVNIDYISVEFLSLITQSTSDNIDNLENYLKISPNLEKAIGPLADELTKDVNSNYVKAKIIERYLSTQYSYTLEPPAKPDNKDFVKYFLFDTKEGFCTHYASAMVMMLRSIDIPCRYVTGYLLDAPLPKDYTGGGVMYTPGVDYDFYVRKNNSHAWVEVWFDDFGWLSFEPTSKYVSHQVLGYPDNAPLDDIYFDDIDIEQITHKPTEDIDYFDLGILILSIIIAVMLIRWIIEMRRPADEKIVHYWNMIKRVYSRRKQDRRINETAREFYMRNDTKNANLLAALQIYEMAVFSDNEMTKEHVDKIHKLYKQIKKQR